MEKTLGKRISEGRKKLGLTQDQLAEKLGVTAQAVSKWENDQSCPDITTLPKLAEIFGITTDSLLGMETVHQAEVVRDAEEDESEGIHFDNGNVQVRYNGGRRGAVWFALWVLLSGGLLLAATIAHWDVSLWDILWPSGILCFGLSGLYPKFSFLHLGCAAFGGYFLAGNFITLPFGKQILLPVLLVLFGLSLLADALRKPRHGKFNVVHNGKNVVEAEVKKSTFVCDEEHFTCSTSFCENDRRIELGRLSGGKASVSFGQLDLDITGCKEFAPDCRLDLSCSFGELDVLVPRTCKVEHSASSSFANVDIEGRPDPDAEARIFLTCSVNFGEICIRYV